jgi:hypothetical protein
METEGTAPVEEKGLNAYLLHTESPELRDSNAGAALCALCSTTCLELKVVLYRQDLAQGCRSGARESLEPLRHHRYTSPLSLNDRNRSNRCMNLETLVIGAAIPAIASRISLSP